jgi:putative transposase
LRTYSTKLILNEEQKQSIMDVLVLEMKVWNYISSIVFEKKTILSLKTIHNECYYACKEKFPTAPSQMIIRSEKSVLSTFKSIKTNKHKISKAPFRKNLSIQLDKRLYSLKENCNIRITTLEKNYPVQVQFHSYDKLITTFDNYEVADPKLFVKNNVIWISFPFKTPVKTNITNQTSTGVDLGINRVAVTSDGIIFRDKHYNNLKRKVRHLKRELNSKNDLRKGGKGKTKAIRRKLKKLSNKERNLSRLAAHRLSKQIVKTSSGNVIVFENLKGIKTNTKKGNKFNNKQSQIPYYMIKEFTTYKAQLSGKKVVTVNPVYTSQIDFRTGNKDGTRKKGRYVGADGKVLNADINAALNIAKRSKLPVSCNIVVIYGQGAINHPYFCKSTNSLVV